MHIDKNTCLLAQARYLASPNFNERPTDTVIDLLVIHSIELPIEAWGSSAIDDLFCNRLDPEHYPFFSKEVDMRVSAHLLIGREAAITQYVPFDKRAWHAGASNFQGRDNCNNFSIGIELEAGPNVAYTDAQYRVLALVARALQQAYPAITCERIVGHSDIAPGRKQDPGKLFDRQRFLSLLMMESI